MRFAVEPCGEAVAFNLELIAFHLNRAACAARFCCALEGGGLEYGFYAAAVFQFTGGLVENILRLLCLGGQQRAGAKQDQENVLDVHGVDVF